MSEYTPGPWKIALPKKHVSPDQKEDRLIYAKINGKTYHVGETYQYRNHDFKSCDGVSLANARLIVAAPELLEACKAIMKQAVNMAELLELDASESVWAHIADCSDVIAKAE